MDGLDGATGLAASRLICTGAISNALISGKETSSVVSTPLAHRLVTECRNLIGCIGERRLIGRQSNALFLEETNQAPKDNCICISGTR